MTRPSELESELRRRVAGGDLTLPDPAAGRTPARLDRLLEIGREDLQIARIAEAHTDAIAILHEAGHSAAPRQLYGVWAAEDPSCQLQLSDSLRRPGGFVLTGTKAFCTGATIVDRALVTVRHAGAAFLIDLDVCNDQVSFDSADWQTPAFGATLTSVATFDNVEVGEADIVGPPGWYLERVGFWHGACGPAACWAGGAIGLVDHAISSGVLKPADPHRDAHLGSLAALRWQLHAMVASAGREIDFDPHDVSAAMQRSLILRHSVERAATAVIDLYGRTVGPRPLIQNPAIVRRIGELQLYIRQHHGEHDLELIGRELHREEVPAT